MVHCGKAEPGDAASSIAARLAADCTIEPGRRGVFPAELAACTKTQFERYLVATVGWDPEEVVNIEELTLRISESGLEGLEGVVIPESLVQRVGTTVAV